jgi:superfamily I DNA and RNA helicase
MGMYYQVEEIVVPALAHVVGSGITVDCGIMYVPNGWWKQVGYVLSRDLTTGQKTIAE